MKIILLHDIKDIGSADTLKDVSDGYARNYLIPKNLAVPADKNTINALNERVKTSEARTESEKAALRELASKINGSQITINADAGEGGKLFGSVTSSDIAQKVHEVLGVEVDKKKIHIDEPIRTTGIFNVPVKFHGDISATIKVNVSASPK